jgi:hypothetical protein
MGLPIIPALIAALAAPSIIQGLTNMYPPFAALTARRGYKQHPDLIPSTDELVGMRIRNVLDDTQFHDQMAEAGFDTATADRLHAGARQYMTALDYITLWRRGELEESEADRLMGELGYNAAEIARIKNVTLYFPTPQDIIRFAVRDVYSPVTIKLYGSDEDIPSDYYEHALQGGLPTETAKQYWMAHWELPSPTQVFEMLHRRIITKEESLTYLRVADYLPYWRDKLQAISYNVLGRIDIRRMFDTGILSEEEVYNAYQDAGYNELNARQLTDFTVAISNKSDTTTPKGVTISAYKAGLIDHLTAVQQLEALKLSGQTIVTMLEIADNDIAQELINLKADAIIDHYTQGGMTLDDVRVELTKIGVSSRMMDLTIQRELAQARKRAKVASKADLDKWLLHGLISKDTFAYKMQQIGYSGGDIELYLAEIDLEVLQGADKKLPYAIPLRKFTSGEISESELTTELQAVGYTEDRLATIVNLAMGITGH